MTFSNLRTMMATAMLGAGLMALATASAEEPGVVRISDGITRIAAESELNGPPAPLPEELTGDGTTMMEANGCQNYPTGYDCYGQECHQQQCLFGCLAPHHGHHGHCNNPNCQECNGNGRGRACCWGKNALPPDYGFNPPTPHPYIWRQPVVYQRYLPDQPYGTPGMRYTHAVQPMVYMPTDTTQLGFNYMHVPQWMPNRANYPLAPNPVMWQRRVPAYDDMYDSQYRVKLKSFHFGRNEQDLMPSAAGPMYLPYQKSKKDDDDKVIHESVPSPVPAPAPVTEASIEIDAQI